MKIYLGADHEGNYLKNYLKKELISEGYDVFDLSPDKPEGGDDYPDYAFAVGDAVARDPGARGILVCDTGIGMSIAANKIKGVRAALVNNVFCAKRSREHNDANVIVFGAQFMDKEITLECVKYFLEIMFSPADRHIRRIGKINYREQFQK